jgi:SAM-dependent methyltransferase
VAVDDSLNEQNKSRESENPYYDKESMRKLSGIQRDCSPGTKQLGAIKKSNEIPSWFGALFLNPVSLLDDSFNLSPESEVLDFGCGIGEQVVELRASGILANGVDIYELWGDDHDLYWESGPIPTDGRAQYLEVISEENNEYKLPYPDEKFDFCYSRATFEHIFNLAEAFGEINRVLRPGGVSIHSLQISDMARLLGLSRKAR